ncbi:MAG TPA: hypothetical protein VF753_19355 [Terriglobales bacterium]
MHVWDGVPANLRKRNEAFDFAVGPEGPAEPTASPSNLFPDWRGLLTVAAVALVGWPFVSSGTFHAMWTEFSRLVSFSRSKS